MTWRDILTRWALVEADLHSVYGIDLHDPALERRSWPWLRSRVLGLLTVESRLARALAAADR